MSISLIKINIAFESGKFPLTIYTDFKKALNTVDFELFVRRLSDFGIRDNYLHLFRSYLYRKSKRVAINDAKSAASRVKC